MTIKHPPGNTQGLGGSRLLSQQSRQKVKALLTTALCDDIKISRKSPQVNANLNLLFEAFVHFSQFQAEPSFWTRLYSALEVRKGTPLTLKDALVWYCDCRQVAMARAARKGRPATSSQTLRLIDKAIGVQKNVDQYSRLSKPTLDIMWQKKEEVWIEKMERIISTWNRINAEKKALRAAKRASKLQAQSDNQGSQHSTRATGSTPKLDLQPMIMDICGDPTPNTTTTPLEGATLRSGVKIISGEAVEDSSEEEDTHYEFSVKRLESPNNFLGVKYRPLFCALSATAQPVVSAGHSDHGLGATQTQSYTRQDEISSSVHDNTNAMTADAEEVLDYDSKYQTKEEAALVTSKLDGRFIQLECNLQRIDAVEEQVRDLQFRRALEGRVSSCPELKSFFEAMSGEIEGIRLKLKRSIRHQDETDEGWKKMLLLGEVLWALDSAAEKANQAVRSL
jgi:hypothetical protein